MCVVHRYTLLLLSSRTVERPPWLCPSRCWQPCSVDELNWRMGQRLLHSLRILPALAKPRHWAVTAAAGRRGERQLERDGYRSGVGRERLLDETSTSTRARISMMLLQHTAPTGLQCSLQPGIPTGALPPGMGHALLPSCMVSPDCSEHSHDIINIMQRNNCSPHSVSFLIPHTTVVHSLYHNASFATHALH